MSHSSLKLAAALAVSVVLGLCYAPVIAFVATRIAQLARVVGP